MNYEAILQKSVSFLSLNEKYTDSTKPRPLTVKKLIQPTSKNWQPATSILKSSPKSQLPPPLASLPPTRPRLLLLRAKLQQQQKSAQSSLTTKINPNHSKVALTTTKNTTTFNQKLHTRPFKC